jgi:hypothetical protein
MFFVTAACTAKTSKTSIRDRALALAGEDGRNEKHITLKINIKKLRFLQRSYLLITPLPV